MNESQTIKGLTPSDGLRVSVSIERDSTRSLDLVTAGWHYDS